MTDEEFDQFVQQAYEEWEQKQDALTKSHRLGKWDEFAYDVPSGLLQFKDGAGKVKVEADTIPLGSFSTKSSTWQWAWANQSYPPPVRKKAQKLKELYKRTGMDVFKMETIEIEDAMAWQLVAMCVDHFKALGSYAMPAGPAGRITVFVSIQEIRTIR